MKGVEKTPAADPDLARFQDAVRQAVNPALANEILGGVFLDVTLAATGTVTRISHTLGRAYQGWCVVRLPVSTTVWEATPTLPTDRFLELEQTAAVPVQVRLYVF